MRDEVVDRDLEVLSTKILRGMLALAGRRRMTLEELEDPSAELDILVTIEERVAAELDRRRSAA